MLVCLTISWIFEAAILGRNRIIKNDRGEFFTRHFLKFYFKQENKAQNIFYGTMSLFKNVHISFNVENK